MANFNRIILIGELVDNPEARSSMDGTAITKFKLSVARSFGTGSDFVDIVSWRNQAEIASKQLKKGDMALVEGSIQIRSFNNQSGERNWVTEVVATSLQPFVQKQPVVAKAKEEEIEELPEDDLPF